MADSSAGRVTMQRAIAAALVIILLLAGSIALWLYTRGDTSGPMPLSIESVDGTVELDHDGATQPGRAGDELVPGDLLRTGDNSSAVLSQGGRSSVQLAENTALRFLGVEDDSVTLALEGGRLRARVRPDAGAVRLQAAGATLVTTDADMDVATLDGALQVDMKDGAATVSGVPGASSIQAGERLNMLADRSAALRPIPEELLLDVKWPGRGREETVAVQGRTEPGALVRVLGQGEGVRADVEGRFTTSLTLAPGENVVEVVIEDGFGEETTRQAKVVRDVKAPVFELDIQYDRKK